MIKKVPSKNTYMMPYPEGLMKQIAAFHKQMQWSDVSIGNLSEAKMKDLDAAVNSLGSKEQEVIRKHYMEHITKKEIASSIGLDYPKICSFHIKGIQHLVRKMCE